MSKMAQELQRQIDELQKQSRIKHRRPKVADEQTSEPESAEDVDQDGTSVEIEVAEDVPSGNDCIALSNDDTMRVLADDPSDTQQQKETDMATEIHGKTRSHHKKPATAKATKAPKKARATKPVKSHKKAASKAKATTATPKRIKRPKGEASAATGRQTQRFALVDGIPEKFKPGSARRVICQVIKERGTATKKELVADLNPPVPDPTLRHCLWTMHTAGVLSIVTK